MRLLLEEVFGEDNYLNTISWRSQTARGAKVNAFYFPFSTQYIHIFAKNDRSRTIWNAQKRRLTFSHEEAAAQFMEDDGGFFRTSDPGTYSFKRLKQFNEEGRLYAPYNGEIIVDEANRRVFASNGGSIGIKYYLTRVRKNRYAVERGVDNLWEDIPGLGTTPGEDIGYPTQKTEASAASCALRFDQAGGHGVGLFRRLRHHSRGGSQNGSSLDRVRHQLWSHSDHSAAYAEVVQDIGPGFTIRAAGQVEPAKAAGMAEISVERDPQKPAWVGVDIIDYQPNLAFLEAAGVSTQVDLNGSDWRRWVDAVDIDTTYDGSVFRSTYSDLPQKRKDLVDGGYTLAIAPDTSTNIAIRITDIFGGECLTVRPV